MQEKSIHNLDTVLLYYCGGSERIIVRMITFRRIVVSLLLCIGAVFASMLPAMSPPLSPPSMTAPAGDHCKRMALASAAAGGPAATCPAHAAYLHWLAWRERHPNAPSKYDKRSNGHALAGFALFFGASEPEPDPSFGGCGCDLATALAPNGCGWMHSQVWGVKRAPE